MSVSWPFPASSCSFKACRPTSRLYTISHSLGASVLQTQFPILAAGYISAGYAPGSIDLFGDSSNTKDGHVLSVALEAGTLVLGCKRTGVDNCCVFSDINGEEISFRCGMKLCLSFSISPSLHAGSCIPHFVFVSPVSRAKPALFQETMS